MGTTVSTEQEIGSSTSEKILINVKYCLGNGYQGVTFNQFVFSVPSNKEVHYLKNIQRHLYENAIYVRMSG